MEFFKKKCPLGCKKVPENASSIPEEQELRIVLVGKTGVGKSATGNTILGEEKFESRLTLKPVTQTCSGEVRALRWNGKQVIVVDTPGLFDGSLERCQHAQESQKCLSLSGAGPHALVFVTQVGHFTEVDECAVKRAEALFGKDAVRKMVLLFTHKEDLGMESLSAHVAHSGNGPLQELLGRCRGRCCAFNNKAAGDERIVQVGELLSQIVKMVRENQEGPRPKRGPGEAPGPGEGPETASGSAEKEELRIVLVGKTGVGKSASGNMILGEERFESKLALTPVTKTCCKQARPAGWNGKRVVVVDTPGLSESSFERREVQKCQALCGPGAHVLVLVTRVGRFTEEDRATLKGVERAFGKEATRGMVVLFTHREDLGTSSLKASVEQAGNGPLQELLGRCHHRCCTFNNRATGEEAAAQVEELLSRAEEALKETRDKPPARRFARGAAGKAAKREGCRICTGVLLCEMLLGPYLLPPASRKRNTAVQTGQRCARKSGAGPGGMPQAPRASQTHPGPRKPPRGAWAGEAAVRGRTRFAQALGFVVLSDTGSEPELRILLIGRMGAGKSATGNTILGFKAFETWASAGSVTKSIERKEGVFEGRKLVVVDTPGVFDTCGKVVYNHRSIQESIALLPPGPHAILLVIKLSAIGEGEQKSFGHMKRLFLTEGRHFLILLFTRGDELTLDDLTLDEFLANASGELKELMDLSGDRFVRFNNRAEGEEREKQVRDLIEQINRRKVLNGRTPCYTQELAYRDKPWCSILSRPRSRTSSLHEGGCDPGHLPRRNCVRAGKTQRRWRQKNVQNSRHKVFPSTANSKDRTVELLNRLFKGCPPAQRSLSRHCCPISPRDQPPGSCSRVSHCGSSASVRDIPPRSSLRVNKMIMCLLASVPNTFWTRRAASLSSAVKRPTWVTNSSAWGPGRESSTQRRICASTEALESRISDVSTTETHRLFQLPCAFWHCRVVAVAWSLESNSARPRRVFPVALLPPPLFPTRMSLSSDPRPSSVNYEGSIREKAGHRQDGTGSRMNRDGGSMVRRSIPKLLSFSTGISIMGHLAKALLSAPSELLYGSLHGGTTGSGVPSASLSGPSGSVLSLASAGRAGGEAEGARKRCLAAAARRTGTSKAEPSPDKAEAPLARGSSGRTAAVDNMSHSESPGSGCSLSEYMLREAHLWDVGLPPQMPQKHLLVQVIHANGSGGVPGWRASTASLLGRFQNGPGAECFRGSSHLLSSMQETHQPRITSPFSGQERKGSAAGGHDVASSAPDRPRTSRELRIVLIGRMGSGKSSTGNCILGRDVFRSSCLASSVTDCCQKEHASVQGREVEVVDTPGFCETRNKLTCMKEHMNLSIAFLRPGPHVILWVIKVELLSRDIMETMQQVKKLFQKRGRYHLVVLFTFTDYLKGTPLQEFIDSAGRELRDLLALAEGRCVGFNNLAEEPERSRQVTELFGVIDGMRRSNTNMPYYSKAALEEDTSSRGSCSLL
ncbi:uncharacterized protein LOC123024459 [Varanus komodoensis]|uniref:uncharacterized protein LOC123024459 n=1 Tax=Varanus komodoensis TaxID=61221 RepID=UPI001CF77008|nr:uncharacterized protein LOC123024459 [Varanus komodoensis]